MDLEIIIKGNLEELMPVLEFIKQRENEPGISSCIDWSESPDSTSSRNELIKNTLNDIDALDKLYWTEARMESLYSNITYYAKRLIGVIWQLQTRPTSLSEERYLTRDGKVLGSALVGEPGFLGDGVTSQQIGGFLSSIKKNLDKSENETLQYGTLPIIRNEVWIGKPSEPDSIRKEISYELFF